jgi:hypothetical protein
MALQDAANWARLGVWAAQPASFLSKTAVIDADATMVPTGAEAKQGVDIAYNGVWGYSALLVSFANTAEPLYLALHGANRPSHQGVVPLCDRAVSLWRQAGFTDVLLRGDTDFSLTTEFERWNDDGVRSCSPTTPGPAWSLAPGLSQTSFTTSWWPGPSGP